MELFAQIRREYRFGVGTVRDVAEQLAVVPVRAKARLGPVIEFLDEILQMDQYAPRKHRQTAHRIWERIREERPEFGVAESTVRHRWNIRPNALRRRHTPV